MNRCVLLFSDLCEQRVRKRLFQAYVFDSITGSRYKRHSIEVMKCIAVQAMFLINISNQYFFKAIKAYAGVHFSANN